MDKAQQDALKKAAGIEAAKLIQNGMIAGLGTGSTAYHMVNAVGEMVKNGLKIQRSRPPRRPRRRHASWASRCSPSTSSTMLTSRSTA